ncbi:MAG: hypothetical protein KBS95_03935 [Alistipes sp.]|nr:hypothetical protein [Candidatus Alistipes equi]
MEIYYDRRNWLNENSERFEISVGSTGSFDLCKNEVGDRARFYMDFGKFLADATLLAALKETFYGYAETINAYHDRMDAIKKQLDSATIQNPVVSVRRLKSIDTDFLHHCHY